jgi:hypothetical protein
MQDSQSPIGADGGAVMLEFYHLMSGSRHNSEEDRVNTRRIMYTYALKEGQEY